MTKERRLPERVWRIVLLPVSRRSTRTIGDGPGYPQGLLVCVVTLSVFYLGFDYVHICDFRGILKGGCSLLSALYFLDI